MENAWLSLDKLKQYLTRQPSRLRDNPNRLRREVAYERIKDAIQYAGLTPGEPLSEVRLSEFLGISRTPVREALQQLAGEGFVEVIPGRAVTVASRSLDDVLNVVHMRSLLEPELVRLAAQYVTQAQAATLLEAVARMEDAVAREDQDAWLRADTVFHDTVRAACPNPLLGDTVDHMRNRVHHLANVDARQNPARLAACTTEHRVIAEAVAARDPATAERATAEHLAALRNSLFEQLRYR